MHLLSARPFIKEPPAPERLKLARLCNRSFIAAADRRHPKSMSGPVPRSLKPSRRRLTTAGLAAGFRLLAGLTEWQRPRMAPADH